MAQSMILLVAALMVFVATGVQGSSHLSFAVNETVNITRDGCGTTKLCVETPDDCDPAGNQTCLFGSVVASPPSAPNGTNLSIELRGNSMGYVALGLTTNTSEGSTMLFICAQNSSNNGSFFFRTMNANNSNGELTPTETRVTEIRGIIKNNTIMCEFDIPNQNASNTRNINATTFILQLGTGTINGSIFSPFNASLTSALLDVTNPASNVNSNTTAEPTTISTNTTTGASSALRPHALLLPLSVLTLSVKLTL